MKITLKLNKGRKVISKQGELPPLPIYICNCKMDYSLVSLSRYPKKIEYNQNITSKNWKLKEPRQEFA